MYQNKLGLQGLMAELKLYQGNQAQEHTGHI